MNAAFLTFVSLLVVGLVLLASVFFAERQSKLAVSRRLNMIAQGGGQDAVSRPRRLGPQAESSLVRFFGLGRGGAWWIKTRGFVLLLVAIGSALAAMMVMGVVFKMPPWASAFGGAGAFFAIPWLMLVIEQGRAEKRFSDRFPDAIDMVVRMLRAGLPVTAALRTVGAEAEPPVSFVFAGLADHVDIGMSLPEALAIAAQEIRLPDFRFFAVALTLQFSTGGNLTTTLEILSEVIRKRRAMARKAKAVTAEVSMTAYILAAIPFVVLGGLLIFDRAYLTPLIVDPRGNLIALAAVSSMLMGFFTMNRMMASATRL